MSTQMGPVESWLRFLGLAVVTIVMAILFGWYVVSLDGPLWIIGLIIVIFGAMIVVGYERLIGW